MPSYTYLAADLATGAVINELPLQQVTFSRLLNDAGSFSAQLPLGDPRVAVLDPMRCTEPARTVIFVVRDGVLVGDYIVWTAVYDSGDPSSEGSGSSISIGGADPLSYFDHRRILPLLPPIIDTSTVARQQLVYADVDRNDIARGLVATAQLHTGGSIGVQLDTSDSGVLDSMTYNGFEMQSPGQALRDLAALADGPDFYFDCQFVNKVPTRFLRLGKPRLGSIDNGPTAAVFEFGANMSQFTYPRDGSGMATRWFGVGDGTDADTPIVLVEDTSLYAGGQVLLEDSATFSGTLTPAQLTAYTVAAQAAVAAPQVLPVLTVIGGLKNQPDLGTFSLGDNIRMVVPPGSDPFFGAAGADKTLRMISYEVTPTDGDGSVETIALTVSPILETA